jgi:hypothetical protein
MTTSFTITPIDDDDDDSNIMNRIFVSIMFKFAIGKEFDSYRAINFIIAIITTFCFYCSVLFAVMFIVVMLNGIMNIKKSGINNYNNSNTNILSSQFYLYLYNNLFGTNKNKNKNENENENENGNVVTEEEEKSAMFFHDCHSSLSQPVQVQVPSSRDENNHHPHQRQRQLRQRTRTTGMLNKQQDQLHLQRFNIAGPPSATATSPSVLNNNHVQQLVDAPHHSYASTIPIPNNNKQQLFALSSSSLSTTGGDGHAYNNNNNNNNNTPYHPIISQEQHQIFLQPRTGDHHHHQHQQHQPKALATASVSGEIVVAPSHQHNAAAGMSSVTIPAGQPEQHHQSDVLSINYFTYDSEHTHDDDMEEWNEDEYNKRFSSNVSIKDTTTARNNASTTTTTTIASASTSTGTLTTKSTNPATKRKSSPALPTTAGALGSAPGSGLLSVNKKKRSRRSAALELSETEIDQHDMANIHPQQQEQPRPSKKQRLLAEAKARAKQWNARTFGS